MANLKRMKIEKGGRNRGTEHTERKKGLTDKKLKFENLKGIQVVD